MAAGRIGVGSMFRWNGSTTAPTEIDAQSWLGALNDSLPEGLGVWVPFFGQPAYTMTLAARLVQQTGATPLLAWGERLPHGAGFMVRVSALPEPLPFDDPAQADPQAACAAAVNRAMESLIRQCPQQYLWGYQRYKSPRPLAALDD